MRTSKIILAEIADNTIWYKFFPYYANTWLVRTDNIYTAFADPDFELENIGLSSVIAVISFQVQKRHYLKVDDIEDVIQNQRTFYYSDSTLLVHFEDHKPYTYFGTEDIEIGFSLGFYFTNGNVIPEWNNQQYYPRALATDLSGSSKDDLYSETQSFQSKNIRIENSDLSFKTFSSGIGVKKKLGNLARILYWIGQNPETTSHTDFTVDYQGIIETVEEGYNISISLRDIRSSLAVKIPDRYLDTAYYTDIKDPDKEYILPYLWGKCYRVPLLCLNENVNKDIDVLPPTSDSSTDYEFLICDTYYHSIASDSVKAVYINGVEVDLSLPTVNEDATQDFAKITIPESYFRNTETDDSGNVTRVRWEGQDKVSVDVYGYLKGSEFIESDGTVTSSPTDLIENALSVLREILRVSYGYIYSNVFYEISSWQAVEDNTNYVYEIGYFINKPIEVWKAIQEISKSILGRFEWNADLKFDYKVDDFVSYTEEIAYYELMPQEYIPNIKIDGRQVLSTFRTGIRKKWDTNDKELSYEWVIDESNKSSALSNYNSRTTKDFLTLINNDTDAGSFITRALLIGGISVDTFTIKVDFKYIYLKAGQWIKVQLDHPSQYVYGFVKAQILSSKPSLSDFTIELELRMTASLPYITDSEGNPITDKYGKYLLDAEVSV